MENRRREPLYQQIENYIISGIENKTFAYHSKIPSEVELCREFEASRMTVNKALTNLSGAGYLERIPGKGSFVRAFKVERKIPEMLSFSEELQQAGVTSESKLLRYSVVTLEEFPEIAKQLRVPVTEMVYHFVRLRLGDGKPLAVSYNYLLVRLVPSLDINCLQTSLYTYLEEQLKLELSHNDTVIQVVPPSEEISRLLHIDAGGEVVRSSHVSFLRGDVAFEYTDTFYNSKQYAFRYQCYRK